MNIKKRIFIIPPRWQQIVSNALTTACLCFVLSKSRQSSPFPLFDTMVIISIVISTFAFLRYATHYAFGDSHLEARLLGIPFWRIHWDEIDKATYLHAWKDVTPKYSAAMGGIVTTIGNSYEQIIYVTLKGCPQYHPQHEIRLFHNLLHPFRTACIWLPYASKNQYIDAFKKYYPDLEMQPIDAWKKM